MEQQVRFGPRKTPEGVKSLIVIIGAVYVVQFVFKWGLHMSESPSANAFEQVFAITPSHVIDHFRIWQLFTYQFLHASPPYFVSFHLIFNIFMLWMFGSDLEAEWGKKNFLKFYLTCGTGAGFFILILPLMFDQPDGPTIGASGAIFGVLLAYAILWPDRQVLVFFIFPVKFKYVALVAGTVSLFGTFNDTTSGISHVGHLGGLITGYLYLVYKVNNEGGQGYHSWNVLQRYKNYKQRRLWLKRQQDLFDEEHMEQKVDSLLDKISRDGIKSLSPEEKKFLKKASQNLDLDGQKEIH